MDEPCGAVGASLLLLAAITAFYDAQRARSDRFYIYPDYFLFHVGRPHGDHSMLDVWPSHKEVVVPDDPEAILEAINDRAITWLVVPDREPAAVPRRRASRRGPECRRLRAGRSPQRASRAPATGSWRRSAIRRPAASRHGDVRIAGNEVTESYARAVLDPEGVLATRGDAADPYAAELARRAGEVAPEARAQLRAAPRPSAREWTSAGELPAADARPSARLVGVHRCGGQLRAKPVEHSPLDEFVRTRRVERDPWRVIPSTTFSSSRFSSGPRR